MLLAELKKIIEIDGQISNMHKELATLYEERARYVQEPLAVTHLRTKAKHIAEGTTSLIKPETWAEQQYSELTDAWGAYQITIPSLPQLKRRFLKARRVIGALSEIDPLLADKFGILLVPPSTDIGEPGNSRLRGAQAFINFDDYINAEMPTAPKRKAWRVLVVYNDMQALGWGSAKDILKTKKYLLGGHDTRGLGVIEHFAFSLQRSQPADNDTWTSLLKDCKEGVSLVPSVTFLNGQYRYELDDVGGIFGDERFRPAVEISA